MQNYLLQQPAYVLLGMAIAFGALASARARRRFTDWCRNVPDGPIRVGLVSNDLHNHPVGYFLEDLLRHADPARVTFLAFSSVVEQDDLTARIRPHLERWSPLSSRASARPSCNAGLPDWLAADDDDYVSKAAHLASDLDRLERLRRGLREQVSASPLFDTARFPRHFEKAVCGMWNRWLEEKDPRTRYTSLE